VTTGRLARIPDSETPQMRGPVRNVPVWCGLSVTIRDENRNRPERATRLGISRPDLHKHPRTPVSVPRVSAGHAADRANAQSIGDMRRGHEAFMPSTCVDTEGRRSR
jgi:hypothetical protein